MSRLQSFLIQNKGSQVRHFEFDLCLERHVSCALVHSWQLLRLFLLLWTYLDSNLVLLLDLLLDVLLQNEVNARINADAEACISNNDSVALGVVKVARQIQ